MGKAKNVKTTFDPMYLYMVSKGKSSPMWFERLLGVKSEYCIKLVVGGGEAQLFGYGNDKEWCDRTYELYEKHILNNISSRKLGDSVQNHLVESLSGVLEAKVESEEKITGDKK